MSYLEYITIVSSRREGLFRLVQFGPTLTEEERSKLRKLVLEYSDLFDSRHQDLPTITLEEHHIVFIAGAKPLRAW